MFFIQAACTFILTAILYFIYGRFTNEGGFSNHISMLFFQVIYSFIFAFVTLLVCGLFGLPIRLSKGLYEWWVRHSWVSFLIMLAGILFFFMALLPAFQSQITLENQTVKNVPNAWLAMLGWALTGFGALHIFPSRTFMDRVNNFVNRSLSAFYKEKH